MPKICLCAVCKVTESDQSYPDKDGEVGARADECYGLSDKVTIAQNERVGRYVKVETGDLEANETVLVEKPFAAVLNADRGGHNCHNCFKRLVAAVPCMTCSGVAFW